MKKLLSILLSAVLCASVVVTKPETDILLTDWEQKPPITESDEGSQKDGEEPVAPNSESKEPTLGGDGF